MVDPHFLLSLIQDLGLNRPQCEEEFKDTFQVLQIDSLDLLSVVTELEHVTGKRIPPEAFLSIRTFQDVIDFFKDKNK